jgi:hypothetical protein
VKFLMNPRGSLLRRLQAITNGQGNHAKYPQGSCIHSVPFLGPKYINKKRVYPVFI